MRKSVTILLALLAAAAAAIAGAVQIGSKPSAGACADPAPSGRFSTYRVIAADGNCLQGYAWVPGDRAITGAVVLVHGLHDHARRYEALAAALNAAGVAVYAFDHRGHGASGGDRQRMDSVDQLVGDVDGSLKEAAKRHPGVPLFIYGHSMGGLVAAQVAARNPLALRGAVISSAALKLPATASGGQLKVVAALSAVAPGLGLEAIDEAAVVRDPAARAALAADPQIVRAKLPARTAATLLAGIVDIRARMDGITLPVLVLHGKDDKVTEVDGSRELATRARSSDKTLRLYDGMLHDLLHEPAGAEVTREIVGFVSGRLQARP